MNQQVKSHWHLVWVTFRKAISITLSLIGRSLRANRYSFRIFHQLERQRELFSMVPERKEK